MSLDRLISSKENSTHVLDHVKPLVPLDSKCCGTGDALWLPNTERPAWLDGSLPGDRGFDPLGLAKPAEYLQACENRSPMFTVLD